MFACEAAGVVPDIITLSKALTGGTLPLAATVATRKVFDAFWSDDPKKALMHGPTFMANALGLRRRQRLARSVRERAAAAAGGGDLRTTGQGARALPRPAGREGRARHGRHRRGRDARIDDLNALRARFVDEGVFIRPFGNIIYLTPAFTIAAGRIQDIDRRRRA